MVVAASEPGHIGGLDGVGGLLLNFWSGNFSGWGLFPETCAATGALAGSFSLPFLIVTVRHLTCVTYHLCEFPWIERSLWHMRRHLGFKKASASVCVGIFMGRTCYLSIVYPGMAERHRR